MKRACCLVFGIQTYGFQFFVRRRHSQVDLNCPRRTDTAAQKLSLIRCQTAYRIVGSVSKQHASPALVANRFARMRSMRFVLWMRALCAAHTVLKATKLSTQTRSKQDRFASPLRCVELSCRLGVNLISSMGGDLARACSAEGVCAMPSAKSAFERSCANSCQGHQRDAFCKAKTETAADWRSTTALNRNEAAIAPAPPRRATSMSKLQLSGFLALARESRLASTETVFWASLALP